MTPSRETSRALRRAKEDFRLNQRRLVRIVVMWNICPQDDNKLAFINSIGMASERQHDGVHGIYARR